MTSTKKIIAVTIDDTTVSAPEGATILEAAKSAGIEIPHFCYHPKLSVPGNCRVCLVEVEGTKDPVISCREKVCEGMVIQTQSELAVEARASVLELILINHPLDCPICDCAGECKLQDYYFEHSRRTSRFSEDKIRKPKAIDAGTHIMLDAERCISCTRCIRFCEEVVGVHEIGLMERGNKQEITASQALNNNYSLCTVDLCPVGALLSKDFRFKKRVWFLSSSPSICTGCATGCNTWIDHQGGHAYRIRPRENEAVNGPWMCDHGRMTYKKLISNERLLSPMIDADGQLQHVEWDEAIVRIAAMLRSFAGGQIAGVLSAQATTEENAVFHDLLTNKLGTPHVFVSGKDSDPSFADDFLRDADMNPNTAGVSRLTTRRIGKDSAYDAYIILGEIADDERQHIVASKPRLIVIASTQAVNWATIALPLAPIEEQDGTIINRNGIEQKVQAAYPPRGESKSGWLIAKLIAEAL